MANVFCITLNGEEMTKRGKIFTSVSYHEFEGQTIDINNGHVMVDGEFKAIQYGAVQYIIRNGKVTSHGESHILIENDDKENNKYIFNGNFLQKIVPGSIEINLGVIKIKWDIAHK